MSSATKQSSFTGPMDRARKVVEMLARLHGDEAETINLAVSGGTDSVVAADLFARIGPEYGLEPDTVTHINTGAGIPQSKLTAKIIAEVHDLEFIEQGYRKENGSLAHRILENGWPGAYGGSPATGGHGLEWANRKDKPMNAVYMMFDGLQIWISGARKLESKKRSGNVPDSGVDQDKPRRVWGSIIGGWTSEEKQEYIIERGLPVSEAYLILGYSGECTACAFDETGLLTNIDLLCPELGHALRSLAVWLYQRVKRGDVELEAKRLCWGWEPDEESNSEDEDIVYDTFEIPEGDDGTSAKLEVPVESYENYGLDENGTSKAMVGCDEESCSTREPTPEWIRDLPPEQIVDRVDVEQYWSNGIGPVADRFDHLGVEA